MHSLEPAGLECYSLAVWLGKTILVQLSRRQSLMSLRTVSLFCENEVAIYMCIVYGKCNVLTITRVLCIAGASGNVTFTGLPVGDYVFRVIANDIDGDKAVIRSGLWIRGNNDFCTVTAINRRVTVFGNTATIEFRNTGTPTGFRCRLDQQQHLPCEFNCHPTTYYIIMKQSHNYPLNFDLH